MAEAQQLLKEPLFAKPPTERWVGLAHQDLITNATRLDGLPLLRRNRLFLNLPDRHLRQLHVAPCHDPEPIE